MQSGGHACQGSGAAREPRLLYQRRPTRHRQARAPASLCPRLWCAWLHACVNMMTAPTYRGRGRGGCKPAARGYPGRGAGCAAAAGGACAARQAAGAAASAGRCMCRQQRRSVCGRGQQQQQRRGQLRGAACAAGRRARQKGLTRPWRRARSGTASTWSHASGGRARRRLRPLSPGALPMSWSWTSGLPRWPLCGQACCSGAGLLCHARQCLTMNWEQRLGSQPDCNPAGHRRASSFARCPIATACCCPSRPSAGRMRRRPCCQARTWLQSAPRASGAACCCPSTSWP
jgi:hypothetical protein